MIFFIVSVFILVFVRLSLCYVSREVTSFDSYFHLFLSKGIRDEGVGFIDKTDRFIVASHINYPYFFHLLLSFFPESLVRKMKAYISSIIDISGILIFSFLAYKLFDLKLFELSLIILLYSLTPLLSNVISSGVRVNTLTPRVFNESISNISFLLFINYFVNEDDLSLVVSLLLFTVSILSGKFSVQVVLFFALTLFFISFNFMFLTLLLPFVVPLLFGYKNYLKILKHQLVHLSWFFRNNLKGKMHTSSRNNLSTVLTLIREKKAKKLLLNLLTENTISIMLLKFPIGVFVIFSSLKNGINANDIYFYLITSSCLIFIVTSTKWFLFVGEAERYFANISMVLILVFVKDYYNEKIMIYSVCLGAFFYLIDLLFTFKYLRQNNSNSLTVLSWLQHKGIQNKNILTIPIHIGGWSILSETSNNWLYNVLWASSKERDFFENNFNLKYGIVDIDKLKDVFKRYSIDIAFIDTKIIDLSDFDQTPWEIVSISNGIVCVTSK